MRCLMLLPAHNELCVCKLPHALAAAQPHISRHLAQLREAGQVADRRQGPWIHCRINPALPAWARTLRPAVRRLVYTTAMVTRLAPTPLSPRSA